MPQELPGFYYDPEKNRYFPVKGPIPGSSRKSASQNPPSQAIKAQSLSRRDVRSSRLLHHRELYGNIMSFSNRKCSFEEEYTKKLASQPKVWKYHDLDRDGDGALTVVQTNVETPIGQYRTDALLTGGVGGSLSLFDVGSVGQDFNHGFRVTSDCIWPENNEQNFCKMPKDLWKLNGATLHMPSSISSISVPRKEHLRVDDDGRTMQCALITTLGSDLSGGSLYLLNLADPVDVNSSIPAVGRLHGLASLNCTIWAGDSDCIASKAVVGTNFGATLVDVETGVSSTLCRSKSDVLSVQLNPLGNAVLCGLRNGAVVTVDLRQRPHQLARHRIAYPSNGICEPCSRTVQKKTKPWFLLRGNIQPSCTVYMPSAISCLVSLQMYDQYFLASSMDGSIKLYDHRLTKRGPIQSYEGHVNSHTRIQLGIDPFERFVMSGGEDCKVRIWHIKSGELLFEEKFTSTIPSTVSWRGTRGSSMLANAMEGLEECSYTTSSSWDAWLGSVEGLFRMQFP